MTTKKKLVRRHSDTYRAARRNAPRMVRNAPRMVRNAPRMVREDVTLAGLKAAIDVQHAKARVSQEQRIGEYLHGRELRRLFFHDRVKLPVEMVKVAEETLRRQGGELGRRGPGQRSVFGLHRKIAYSEVRAALRQRPVFA